jgi:hypothetical protein
MLAAALTFKVARFHAVGLCSFVPLRGACGNNPSRKPEK